MIPKRFTMRAWRPSVSRPRSATRIASNALLRYRWITTSRCSHSARRMPTYNGPVKKHNTRLISTRVSPTAAISNGNKAMSLKVPKAFKPWRCETRLRRTSAERRVNLDDEHERSTHLFGHPALYRTWLDGGVCNARAGCARQVTLASHNFQPLFAKR